MTSPISFFNREAGTAGVLNSAEFIAPLSHSLGLNRGTGSATLTRATTKTVTGYGPTANSGDSQVLLTCAAGEAGFTGARRISEGVWSDTFADGSPIPASTLKGISIEGAGTNLCLQSNAFTTTWTAFGTPAATQNATGPDGGTTAWTLTDNDGAATEGINQNITLTAAAYTFSIFVGKTSGAQSSYPVLYAYNGTTAIALVTIDTSNGVVTPWVSNGYGATPANLSQTCEDFSSTLWRVSFSFTATAAAWGCAAFPAGSLTANKSSGTLDVTAQGSAVFYGAQVELGSFATSYQSTTTIAAAKNLDLESTPTASNVAAAASSVAIEYTPLHAPSGTVFLWATYVDASNYTAILHDGTNLICRKRIAATNYDATIANAFVAGTTYKAVGTWGAGGVTITLNGTEGTPHANTTAAQIGSTMQTGGDGNGANQAGMSFKNVRIAQRQYSASERLAVTQ